MAWRRGWMTQKVDGRKSFRVCYEHIGPPTALHGKDSFLDDIWSRSSNTRGNLAPYFSDWRVENDQLLYKHLDLIKESRDVASVRLANYQQKIYWRYNKGIKNKEFIPGDLVLRKVLGNTWDPAMGKLGPTWEGPYRITSIAGVGAYWLKYLDEKPIARSWNVFNLKKYYFWL